MKKKTKKLKTDWKGLFESGVGELTFEKMQVDFLKNALQEIRAFTSDNLVRMVVDTTIQRHELDKLIHARVIFDENILNKPPF